MTTETSTETVTVELSVETAYVQLVSFQEAVNAFNKADEEDDADGRLEADRLHVMRHLRGPPRHRAGSRGPHTSPFNMRPFLVS